MYRELRWLRPCYEATGGGDQGFPTQPLITRLHGRVQDHLFEQNLPDALFGEIVILNDLDGAAMFGVRAAGISSDRARRELEGVAGGKDGVVIGVDEDGADAEVGGGGGGASCLVEGVLQVGFVIASWDIEVVQFGAHR